LKSVYPELADYFIHPISQRQKQYEAIRAIVVDNHSIDQVAKRFGYKNSTLYALLRDVKAGKIDLFPKVAKGPRGRRTPSEIQKKIIFLRRQRLSSADIRNKLAACGNKLGTRTIERILKDAGFSKLPRRTNKELGKTARNQLIPQRAEHLDFSKLEPFSVDCPIGGVFFFIPYVLESGILDIIKAMPLPESSVIGATQACLSMLFLKLIGGERLSHIAAYDQEPGLGIFAGLNILPKTTYMNTYSCRCSEPLVMELQNKIVTSLEKKYPHLYRGDFINLDFHSIPHYGDESEMEKVWCGSKGKTLKGANTVLAQDSQSNVVLYTRTDILRKEEAQEVKKFVDYWKKINRQVDETLVFDCKFTSYDVLDELDDDHVKFITLRKRNAKLVNTILELPKEKWQRIYIPIPKRKHKYVSVYESDVQLNGCQNTFRQIVIKDHGRSTPTLVLTNNRHLSLQKCLVVYAQRWRVENKLAELVAFFNLNALSSPIMIRIHFDVLWTMIADTLYHVFAQDLRRFEGTLAPQLFRKFIDMPGRIIYDGDKFVLKIRKRAHTPILKEVGKLKHPISVPWLDGKFLEIVWTA